MRESGYHEIVSNECVNNGRAGIRIGEPPLPSALGDDPPPLTAHDILVKSNWIVFNQDGIVVERAAHDNTLTNNTSLANFHRDMIDNTFEPPCRNTWFLNFFLTKDGAGEDCIF